MVRFFLELGNNPQEPTADTAEEEDRQTSVQQLQAICTFCSNPKEEAA